MDQQAEGPTMGQILAQQGAQTEDLRRLCPDSNGKYAWDRWQDQAIANGIEPDLTTLGRAVMREAVQHDWSEALKTECGWQDDGNAMLHLALTAPEKAKTRWETLLETDGGRIS